MGDGLSSDQNIACLMNEGGSRNIKQHQGFYDVILNQKLDFITKGLSFESIVVLYYFFIMDHPVDAG